MAAVLFYPLLHMLSTPNGFCICWETAFATIQDVDSAVLIALNKYMVWSSETLCETMYDFNTAMDFSTNFFRIPLVFLYLFRVVFVFGCSRRIWAHLEFVSHFWHAFSQFNPSDENVATFIAFSYTRSANAKRMKWLSSRKCCASHP